MTNSLHSFIISYITYSVMPKISISALNKKSGERLAKAMSMDDLRTMAELHGDVVKGNITVELYRQFEQAMITKYSFTVK